MSIESFSSEELGSFLNDDMTAAWRSESQLQADDNVEDQMDSQPAMSHADYADAHESEDDLEDDDGENDSSFEEPSELFTTTTATTTTTTASNAIGDSVPHVPSLHPVEVESQVFEKSVTRADIIDNVGLDDVNGNPIVYSETPTESDASSKAATKIRKRMRKKDEGGGGGGSIKKASLDSSTTEETSPEGNLPARHCLPVSFVDTFRPPSPPRPKPSGVMRFFVQIERETRSAQKHPQNEDSSSSPSSQSQFPTPDDFNEGELFHSLAFSDSDHSTLTPFFDMVKARNTAKKGFPRVKFNPNNDLDDPYCQMLSSFAKKISNTDVERMVCGGWIAEHYSSSIVSESVMKWLFDIVCYAPPAAENIVHGAFDSLFAILSRKKFSNFSSRSCLLDRPLIVQTFQENNAADSYLPVALWLPTMDVFRDVLLHYGVKADIFDWFRDDKDATRTKTSGSNDSKEEEENTDDSTAYPFTDDEDVRIINGLNRRLANVLRIWALIVMTSPLTFTESMIKSSIAVTLRVIADPKAVVLRTSATELLFVCLHWFETPQFQSNWQHAIEDLSSILAKKMLEMNVLNCCVLFRNFASTCERTLFFRSCCVIALLEIMCGLKKGPGDVVSHKMSINEARAPFSGRRMSSIISNLPPPPENKSDADENQISTVLNLLMDRLSVQLSYASGVESGDRADLIILSDWLDKMSNSIRTVFLADIAEILKMNIDICKQIISSLLPKEEEKPYSQDSDFEEFD